MKSQQFIDSSHASMIAMFVSAVFGFPDSAIAIFATSTIVCAILSVAHAIREQARG